MKLHLPLLKTLIFAITPIVLLFVFAEQIHFYLLWFVAGLLYTHFFEYFYHRIFLHKKLIFTGKLLKNHMIHHFNLRGEIFSSRDPDRLTETLTKWSIFPILFITHYLIFRFLFSQEFVISFFTGVTIHFVSYQTTHWFTHIQNSVFHRLGNYIPVIAWQIEHHRIHHNNFVVNYNFCPPYLGDRIFKTKK